MKVDTDTMLRLMRGEIPEAEANSYREHIAADPQLAMEFHRVKRMEGLLKEGAVDSFGPYFAERVMRRLVSSGSAARTTLYESMQWVFLRLAVASLIVVVGLGVYGAIDAQESEVASSTIEAVFGLPSTDLESLFYLQGI